MITFEPYMVYIVSSDLVLEGAVLAKNVQRTPIERTILRQERINKTLNLKD